MIKTEPTLVFESEQLAAQRVAAVGRCIAMVAIAVLLTVLIPWPMPIYYYFTLSTFALLGWTAFWVAQSRWGRSWHQYVFVTADFAFLTFVILYPNPMSTFDFTPQIALRGGAFVHFFVLLAGLTYIYQPRLVLWGGVSAVATWMAGVGILIAQPETVWRSLRSNDLPGFLQDFANPNFVDFSARLQETAVILIVSGFLALAVKRSRVIALR